MSDNPSLGGPRREELAAILVDAGGVGTPDARQLIEGERTALDTMPPPPDLTPNLLRAREAAEDLARQAETLRGLIANSEMAFFACAADNVIRTLERKIRIAEQAIGPVEELLKATRDPAQPAALTWQRAPTAHHLAIAFARETLSLIWSACEDRMPSMSYGAKPELSTTDVFRKNRLAVARFFRNQNLVCSASEIVAQIHLEAANAARLCQPPPAAEREAPAEAEPAPSKTRGRMSKEEANEKAKRLAKSMKDKFFLLPVRQQAHLIGCSFATWTKTTFYHTARQRGVLAAKRKRRGSRPAAPRPVNFSDKIEETVGEEADPLEALIAEQEQDMKSEPSPLDKGHRKVRDRKRL